MFALGLPSLVLLTKVKLFYNRVLDLSFDIVDRVAGLDIQRDGLAREGLHEYLHTAPQAKHKVEGGLLLNVVVRPCCAYN